MIYQPAAVYGPSEHVHPDHVTLFTGDMGVGDESRGDNEAWSLPHRKRETSTGIHLQRMGMCTHFHTHKLMSLHSYLGPCNYTLSCLVAHPCILN